MTTVIHVSSDFKRVNRHQRTGRYCYILHQFLWRRVCANRTFTHSTTTNLGSPWNSDIFAKPRRTPTGAGTGPCTDKPGTRWQMRSEWPRGSTLKSWRTTFLLAIRHQSEEACRRSPATGDALPPVLGPTKPWLTTSAQSIAALKRTTIHLSHAYLLHPPPPTPLNVLLLSHYISVYF